MEGNNVCKVIHINTCIFCGRELKDEWKFCPHCKKKLEKFSCIFCGQELNADWNYCPKCKKEIEAEHKNIQRVDKCNDWLRSILKS